MPTVHTAYNEKHIALNEALNNRIERIKTFKHVI